MTKQMESKNYPIVVRWEKKTKQYILFMKEGDQLHCYTRKDGHAVSDTGYYHKDTIPVAETEARQVFDAYIGDGKHYIQSGFTPVLRKRLTR